MKNTARELFHKPPERMNCAQAVLAAYQQLTGDTRLSVPEMKAMGGGRAPGGVCGALHAACAVVPEKAEALTARFVAETGSALCKELKSSARVSCVECVGAAADILSRELRDAKR